MIEVMASNASINEPALWLAQFPWPRPEHHKYDRGHAVILGGAPGHTGAAKLAALSALRSGAGLVSVVCNAENFLIYASAFQAVMTPRLKNEKEYKRFIQDTRVRSLLLGPGAGQSARTKSYVLSALTAAKPIVLDADALTVFADMPKKLFKAIRSPCILTPHEGEFRRLFPAISHASNDKILWARKAATESGAVILLKGHNTLIAAPGERTAVNQNATPFLATAGSGDCLAGICTGLLAQGMPAFEAAAAAVWLHSRAAETFGPGLISDDIPSLMPRALTEIYQLSQ